MTIVEHSLDTCRYQAEVLFISTGGIIYLQELLIL